MTRFYLVDDHLSGHPVAHSEANTVAVKHGRPVVVIDPEDREQVYALADLMTQQLTDKDSDPAFCAAMLTALREFANPKPAKPDEPTGLGAVVEDTDGNRWVRVDDPSHSWVRSLRDEGTYTQRSKWGHLDAVAVLSKGVQS